MFTRTTATPTDLRHRARDVGEDLAERARDVSEELAERARDVSEDLAERSRPLVRDVADRLTQLLRFLLRFTAVLPAVAAKVLGGVAAVLHRLGDRAEAIADLETPTQVERRRGRRRTVLWFSGGFLAGAATGYAASEYLRKQPTAEPASMETVGMPTRLPRPDGSSGTAAG